MQNRQFERRSFVQQKVVLFCSIIFILCGSIVSYAQSNTATLRGTVSDENDAALPRVEITITNNDNQSKRTIHTNGSGFYTAPGLPPGTYRVIAQTDGFAPKEVQDIVLNTSDQRRLDIQLKVKGASAAVTVTADTAINDGSAIATTFDKNFVKNIPLNGRTLQSLLFMTPGVVITDANGEISVNGQRTNENYYTIDGVSANIGVSIDANAPSRFISGSQLGTNVFGGTNGLVSIEELEEIKVQTSNSSAAFGRMTGAQVQMTTKTGGNQFHGSLYEYFRNEVLDANDWSYNSANRGKAPLRFNHFGGTFSGPVHIPTFGLGNRRFINGKDRTFFFINMEGLRILLPQPIVLQPTPLQEFRSQIKDPTMKALIDALPLPTMPAPVYWPWEKGVSTVRGYYPFADSFLNEMNKYTVKINHNINSTHSLSGRLNKSPSHSTSYLGLQQVNNWRNINVFTVGYQTVISPVMHNEVNFNYSIADGKSKYDVVIRGGGEYFDLRTLVPGAPERSLIRYTLPPEVYQNAFAQGDRVDNQQEQYNLTDNFSWIIGNHTFNTGFDFRRMSPRYAQQDYDLSYFTNHAGSLTLKHPKYDLLTIVSRNEVNLSYDNYSYYGGDSWRVNNRFGLDIGLRWDINPAPRGTNVPLYTLNGFPDIQNMTLAPGGAQLYPTRYTGVSPNFGFSYLLNTINGRETVLRGGYRIVNSLGAGSLTEAANQFPHFGVKRIPNGTFPASGENITPAILPSLQPIPKGSIFSLAAPDYALPRTHTWSLGIQQSLGKSQTLSISYVGNAGRRLLRRYYMILSPSEADATPNFLYNRNLPNAKLYITRNDTGYGDMSDYNSMQVDFDRRLSRGLQMMANYTWAHAISTGDTDEGSNGLTIGMQPTLSRIDSSFDRRHVFSSLLTYELPAFRWGNRALSLINKVFISGWSTAGSYRYQSGTPMTIYYSVRNPEEFSVETFAYRADRVLGQPILIDKPQAPGKRVLNPEAFAPNPAAITGYNPSSKLQGTLNPHVARNVGIYQFDFSLRRTFKIREQWNLVFNCDVFNILNHPTFATPDTNIGVVDYTRTPDGSGVLVPNPKFGIANRTLARSGSTGGLSQLFTIGGPRSIQLSMKLEF